MTEKKVPNFFNFISLSTFVEYVKTRLGDQFVSNLVLVLKFSNIVENSSYRYYNFLLGGIYDKKRGCIVNNLPDLARVKGINFSEKRGEFLMRTFEDRPFFAFEIRPLMIDLTKDNFYYTFKTARVAEQDFSVVEQNILERATFADQGGIAFDDTFEFSLSK